VEDKVKEEGPALRGDPEWSGKERRKQRAQ
jgi:hypothetical protein